MTARRKLFAFPLMGLAAAMLWTSLGTFDSASGQEQPIVIERTHEGDLRPSFDEPIFVLVLGGDARQGNPTTTRTDSIHIVAIDPVGRSATIVGIPRDSYVDIPGHRRDKIAHAQYFVGTKGAVATVENLSGCRFDYHMLTSFKGFAGKGYRGPNSKGGLINDLGGIRFKIPKPGFTDSAALGRKLEPLPPGNHVLDGAYALAWARSRKDSALRPRGDFDRSLGQGELMVAILRELRKDFAEDPGTALRALGAVRRNVRMNIGLTESLELGLALLDIKPGDVTNVVVDGEIGTEGGASIVRITQEGINQLADVCADGILDNA